MQNFIQTLTQEQRAKIFALRDSPNGQSFDITSSYPQSIRDEFEKAISMGVREKIGYGILSGLPLAVLTFMHMKVKAYPSPSLAMMELFICALWASSQGYNYLNAQDWRIKDVCKTYDTLMSKYESVTQLVTETAVRFNFVKDANDIAKAGGTISMAQLAKLVNIDNKYFLKACNRLAITVLQAKALVMIKKGLVEEFEIATYNSLPLADTNPQTIANTEHDNERILLHTLRDQFDAMKYIKNDNEQEQQAPPNNPHCPLIKQSWGLKAFIDWFAKGFKGNTEVFRKISADDFLPPVPKSIFIEAIPSEEDLGALINMHSMENQNHLDLPALKGWQPKVI